MSLSCRIEHSVSAATGGHGPTTTLGAKVLGARSRAARTVPIPGVAPLPSPERG